MYIIEDETATSFCRIKEFKKIGSDSISLGVKAINILSYILNVSVEDVAHLLLLLDIERMNGRKIYIFGKKFEYPIYGIKKDSWDHKIKKSTLKGKKITDFSCEPELVNMAINVIAIGLKAISITSCCFDWAHEDTIKNIMKFTKVGENDA